MDFAVNDLEVGSKASEVKLAQKGTVRARVKVAAFLNPVPLDSDNIPSDRGKQYWKAALTGASEPGNIRDRPIDQNPYWHIERARIGNTRASRVGHEWQTHRSERNS